MKENAFGILTIWSCDFGANHYKFLGDFSNGNS